MEYVLFRKTASGEWRVFDSDCLHVFNSRDEAEAAIAELPHPENWRAVSLNSYRLNREAQKALA